MSVADQLSINQKRTGKVKCAYKNVRISKAKDDVVASLEVISPENPASLWEALKRTQAVEKALCTTTSTSAEQKYLKAPKLCKCQEITFYDRALY